MLATNYSTLRENLKKYMDKVTDDHETLIITRKDDRNVVMLSEEAYSNILENMRIIGDRDYYAKLIASKNQYEEGRVVKKSMDELYGKEAAYE